MGKKPFPICACPCGADPCVTDGTWYLTLQNYVHTSINSHATASRALSANGISTRNYWFWWDSTLHTKLNSIADMPFNLQYFPSLDAINRNPDPDNTWDGGLGGGLSSGHYVLLDLGIAEFSDTLYWAPGTTKPSSFLFTPETITYTNLSALVYIGMNIGGFDRTPYVWIYADVTSSLGTVFPSGDSFSAYPYCYPTGMTFISGPTGDNMPDCGLPLNCDALGEFVPFSGNRMPIGFDDLVNDPHVSAGALPSGFPLSTAICAVLDKTP